MQRHEKNPDLKYHVLRAAINRFGKAPRELEPEQLDQVRFQALKECELEQLVLDSVEARDVHIPTSVSRDAIKQVEQKYPDKETYISDLADNGLNEELFNQAIERELRVNTVLDRIASRAAKVSELDCMLFYYMHKDKFNQPETRTARHILITLNDDFAENRRMVALQRM